jgi:hypothetical protein
MQQPESTDFQRSFDRRQHRPIAGLLRFGVMAIALIVTGDAIGRLFYSAISQIPNSAAWNYGILLYAFLAVSAIAAIVAPKVGQSQSLINANIARLLANCGSLAILGFYHIGNLSGQQPQWAAVGAIGGIFLGGLGSAIGQRRPSGLMAIGLASLRSTTTYCAAFANGTIGLMALSVGYWWGVGLVLIGLIYLIGACNLLLRLVRQ